jgi:hypothetical protein
LIASLLEEGEVSSFFAGAICVADDYNDDRSTKVLGLDEEALDILFALREPRFLTVLQLGAS